MKKMLSFIGLILFVGAVIAQTKVAAYSIGEYGTDQYESLSFWIKDNKRAEIYYRSGKEDKGVKLKFAGVDSLYGVPYFKIQFPNTHILFVLPRKNKLVVTDMLKQTAGSKTKVYSWEYEGPVNGIGTFCEPCAEDDADAMKIMETYYFKK